MATVRDVAFDVLRALDLTTVFGNPGSTELPFLKDFPPDFTYVLGLQESVVVAMADGFAQARRHAALVNLHTSAGLGNGIGAIVTAYHNRTPLVVTAGQQDRKHLALEPLLSGRLTEMATPYVKWSHEPARAQDVPAALTRAYYTAMQDPQGPVFVSIPMDDWDAECDPYAVRPVSHRVAPDPVLIAEVAGSLNGSKKPALVAGGGIDRAGPKAWAAVVTLAEKLGADVWADPIGSRAGFPQDHPLFCGHLAPAQALVGMQLAPYDVVLALGAPVFLAYPYVPGAIVSPEATLFQITASPDEAAYAAAGSSIVGDPGLGAGALLPLVVKRPTPAPGGGAAPASPEKTTPMTVDYVMHTLAVALPRDAVIADEAISSKSKMLTYVRAALPGSFYTSASGGLGFAMPAAVGLQLATPERQVVCVIGDGSSMYAIQALWTAARHNLPVVFVVINNGQYAILKAFSALIGTGENVPGLDLPAIDLVAIAKALGCDADTVAAPDDLAPTLARALAATKPTLVNVLVDHAVPSLI